MSNRITFVISSLGVGGAERVLSIMANYWACKGDKISILTFNSESDPPFYELDPRINCVPLGINKESGNFVEGLGNNIKRVRTLRCAIRETKPDVVISFMTETNIVSTLALVGLKIPILVAEHNDPGMRDIGIIWNKLRNIVYPMATAVILLNDRFRAYYPATVRKKSVVIPNPVEAPPNKNSDVKITLNRPVIVAMGRLGYEKGFDLLLRAFALIKDKHPAWSITILGEGALRKELEDLRVELDLGDRVCMPGLVRNTHNYLRQADIFVLSSRYEAFPMALCEAMACGAPVVSFDCNSGPRDIITDGVDGLLVAPEDVNALATALSHLMDSEAKRADFSKKAPEIVERFGVDKVMEMWEVAIKKVSGGN